MKTAIRTITLPIALLSTTLLLTACGSLNQRNDASVSLHHCVIQESIPGAKATGAFLTIKKQGDAPLSLVRAESPNITPHVEIHEMTMKEGKMKMQQIKEYPLVAGDNIFAKGGYHIMLMDVKNPVAVGEHYPLILHFSDGSSQSCRAEVKSVDSLTPKKTKHMKKGMKKTHQHH